MEFTFDDDIFETKTKPDDQNKIFSQDLKNYKPKQEFPGYFLTDQSCSETTADILRMKANYFYMKFNYLDALNCYKTCFEMALSDGAKFEYLESEIYCYLKLNQPVEARETALSLFKLAANFDQQVQALYALQYVYDKTNALKDCAIVAASLLTQFDSNPQLWITFGRTVVHLQGFSGDRPCESCLSALQYASFVRSMELIKLLQLDTERKHLTNCMSNCAQLLSTCESKLQYDQVQLQMCQDINGHNKVVADGEPTSDKLDGQKLDCDFNLTATKFLNKWFRFVFAKCNLCTELLN